MDPFLARKQRILFVDDDASMLAALRTMLHRERKRWDMVFTSSAELALEEFRKQPFDVVVSDMRMPRVDGAALLTTIKTEFPSAARILLSGFAEPEAIARALPALHQLLAKPCDRNTLRTSIEHSIDATAAWSLGRIDRLPSPRAVLETFALALAASSIDATVAVVESDPGLAAKLLQLVCSAYYGEASRSLSIRDAVELFGTDRLESLRATTPIFASLGAHADGAWLELLRARAVRGAERARASCPDDRRDLAYTAALLRDVGRLVLAIEDNEYCVLASVLASDRELLPLECSRYSGVTHAELGGWLLGLWGLPSPITDLVRYHHHPDLAPPELRALATIINATDAGAC